MALFAKLLRLALLPVLVVEGGQVLAADRLLVAHHLEELGPQLLLVRRTACARVSVCVCVCVCVLLLLLLLLFGGERE